MSENRLPVLAKLTDVLTDCQTGNHSQAILIKILLKVYQSVEPDEFFELFVGRIKYFLIVFKREPVVERAIDFIAKFSTSMSDKPAEGTPLEDDDDMHPFLLKLFNFLLKHLKARDKAVRFRCCQLVNKLLCAMGDDAQIADELYEKIYNSMLIRLRDKFPVVRMHAVIALSRLQDPSDKDCPIIEAYKFMLECDLNADVRRAVLSSIAASVRTLPAILARTQDSKDAVRRLAYQVIAEKIHIRALTIAQRVKLLQQGLNDRTEVVKDVCISKLLQAWLRIYEGNALELLNSLDVDNSLAVCQQMLQVLFKKTSTDELASNFKLLNDELVIPLESLTCENALYWHCLCEHIRSLGPSSEEQLDKILPTGVVFSKYLISFAEWTKNMESLEDQLRNEFILQQLVDLMAILDLSDEVARKHIVKSIRELLLADHVGHTVVKSLLTRYSRLHVDSDACINSLAEIISDIREPIVVKENVVNINDKRQTDLKLAAIRVELNQLRDELDNCVSHQEFERAAEIKQRVTVLDANKQTLLDDLQPTVTETRTEKNDPPTLLKCLSIATELLTDARFKKLTPSLHGLIETLIIPGIQNNDPAVRNRAIMALGLACLRSVDKARDYLLLFYKASTMDQEVVRISALQAIFDLLHFFGLEVFDMSGEIEMPVDKSPEILDESNSSCDDFVDLKSSRVNKTPAKENAGESMLDLMTTLLDDNSSEIRTVCAEGFAKLLLAGRILSPTLLSRLLIQWYNPITEDDTRLRHCLGTFIPIYAFASRRNQDVVAEAFLPTLKTLFDAPGSSPLAEVKVMNVAELLVELTDARHQMSRADTAGTSNIEEHNPHDDIAIKVSNEILSDPNSFDVRVLVKVLSGLKLSQNNEDTLKDLKVLAQRMLKGVKDKQCSKLLEKFRRHIKDLLQRSNEPNDGENAAVDDTTRQTPASESDDDTNCTRLGNGDSVQNGMSLIGERLSLSKPSQISKPKKGKRLMNVSKRKSEDDDDYSSEDGGSENDVFAAPAPVRSTTSRKAKTVALELSKRNLDESSDTITESDASPAPVKSKWSTGAKRGPLKYNNEQS